MIRKLFNKLRRKFKSEVVEVSVDRTETEVLLVFNKPVAVLSLDRDRATTLADALRKNAKRLR